MLDKRAIRGDVNVFIILKKRSSRYENDEKKIENETIVCKTIVFKTIVFKTLVLKNDCYKKR